MSKTSNAVKQRYNQKTYSQWNCRIKKDKYNEIEELRTSLKMSRAQFLIYLIESLNKRSTK